MQRRVHRRLFLRGTVGPLSEEQTLAAYELLRARLLSRGLTKAPDRCRRMCERSSWGLHVSPVRLRVDGFGAGAESFSWSVKELT